VARGMENVKLASYLVSLMLFNDAVCRNPHSVTYISQYSATASTMAASARKAGKAMQGVMTAAALGRQSNQAPRACKAQGYLT
jgi:hypothetical protein